MYAEIERYYCEIGVFELPIKDFYSKRKNSEFLSKNLSNNFLFIFDLLSKNVKQHFSNASLYGFSLKNYESLFRNVSMSVSQHFSAPHRFLNGFPPISMR
jgi:hypothetical protein